MTPKSSDCFYLDNAWKVENALVFQLDRFSGPRLKNLRKYATLLFMNQGLLKRCVACAGSTAPSGSVGSRNMSQRLKAVLKTTGF